MNIKKKYFLGFYPLTGTILEVTFSEDVFVKLLRNEYELISICIY